MANVYILAESEFNHRYRYHPERGWMGYSQGVWTPVENLDTILNSAGEVLEGVLQKYRAGAVVGGTHGLDEKGLQRWSKDVGTARILQGTLKIACGSPAFLTPSEKWDSEPLILNVRNGVLDLATGILDLHSPDRYMTGQAGATFDPTATHPAFDELIRGLQLDNREYFLSRAAGRALYGLVKTEEMLAFFGSGGSGKGSFVSAFTALLGTYSVSIPITSLLVSSKGEYAGAARPDILRLAGKRLVTATEPPQNVRLNAALVKSLTGRDTVTARGLYKAPVDFVPTFSLWIQSNYDVLIDGDDSGMKRRLRVIPFSHSPAAEREGYKSDLQSAAALSALLNWSLKGFQEWYVDKEASLKPGHCDVIIEATNAYWRRMNPVAEFFDVHLQSDPSGSVLSETLIGLLGTYVVDKGIEHGGSSAKLFAHLKLRGARSEKRHQQRVWTGISLLPDVQ